MLYKDLKLSALMFAMAATQIYAPLPVAAQHSGNDKPTAGFMSDLETRIKKNPQDVNAYCRRGQIYLDGCEWEAAIKDFNAALKIAPNTGRALVGRATALASLGENAKALVDCNLALKLRDPAVQTEALQEKIMLLREAKRYKECIPLLTELLDSKNSGFTLLERYDVLTMRAQTYLFLNQPELAIADIKQCTQESRRQHGRYLILGQAYAMLNKSDKAIEAYSEGIQKSERDPKRLGHAKHDKTLADLYLARAELYRKQKKTALADADVKKARQGQGKMYDLFYEPIK